MSMAKERVGFVYFIRAVNRGWVKIGWAVDPKLRLSLLQCGSADPLELVLSYPGRLKEERDARGALRGVPGRGEWKRAEPETEALIDLLLATEPQKRAEAVRLYSAEKHVAFWGRLQRGCREAARLLNEAEPNHPIKAHVPGIPNVYIKSAKLLLAAKDAE